MKRSKKITVLGYGKIGYALYYFLNSRFKVILTDDSRKAKGSSLVLGALPGSVGRSSLELALRCNKDLIDISDTDPQFYIKYKRDIYGSNITVIAGCGFSPGLVNFILGWEFSQKKHISTVEIIAGSLSPKKGYFPFLWCFEDFVSCHNLKSRQLVEGKEIEFDPFSGLRKERFFGIEAETYFFPSGFEYLMRREGLRDFTYRVARPVGFSDFFKKLKENSFFSKDNISLTKKIFDSNREDNITFAIIRLCSDHRNRRTSWLLKSFSKKKEKLNSMQKITSILPVVLTEMLLEGKFLKKGLFFPDDISREEIIFRYVMDKIKNYKVEIRRYG
ncbi:MAG: hypothetical protein NC826_02095 [Candidatus Omnitrophica bacterium]|nr:hypothetical protein [Candidatus Omnitrophota bacterium]